MNRKTLLPGTLVLLLGACSASQLDAPPPGMPVAPGVRAIGAWPPPDHGPRTGTTHALQSFTPKAQGKRPPSAFRTRWSARVGRTTPRTTMAQVGTKIVVGTLRGEGDTGGVYVLDGRSGEVLKRVASEHRDVAGIAVDGERVFFTTESGRAVAARLDGSLAWTTPVGAPLDGAPALADVDGDGSLEVVVAASDGAFVVLDAGTGRVRYRRALVPGPRPAHAPPIAIADVDRDGRDDILAGSGAGVLSAHRGRDGEPLWTTYPGAPIDAPPVLADLDGDGGLEAITAWSDGAVAILDVATGSALWRAKVEKDDGGGETLVASPVMAPAARVGRLVAASARADGGSLVVLAEHQRTFRADVGPVRATPVVMRLGAEGSADAVVGTERGDLVALDGVGGFTFLAALGAPVDASALVADFEPDGARDLVVVTRDGTLRAFATSATAAPLVARYRGDSGHNRGVVRASPLAWTFARGRPALSLGK